MPELITVPTIVGGLRDLGVKTNTTLLVHCSLSSIGRIQGGAQALLYALQEVVSDKGTLVMPTFNVGRFDPSQWGNPPAPEETWQRIRYETPLYDPERTPADDAMSKVYELFRTWPHVKRTAHPHTSFAAWGKHRDLITESHRLEDRLGNTSPLAKLYDLDAQVLFLGTGYLTNTCFHLGEYRQAQPPVREFMIVQSRDGVKELVTYEDVDTNSSIFDKIGDAFEEDTEVMMGKLGAADCRLFSLRQAVDFATAWLDQQKTNP